MTPQQLQQFNQLFEKYQRLNLSVEEASRKAIRDMTQKGILKPQGGKKPVPRLTKGDWFQQLKATGTVVTSAVEPATTVTATSGGSAGTETTTASTTTTTTTPTTTTTSTSSGY